MKGKGYFFSMKRASVFKNLVKLLSQTIHTTEMKFNPDGLHIHALGVSHVCFVHLNMPKDCFEEYSCEKETEIVVNMGTMEQIMRFAGERDKLKMIFEKEKLKIILTDVSRSKVSEFKLKQLESTGEDELMIPENSISEETIKIKMDSKELSQTLKSMHENDVQTVHFKVKRSPEESFVSFSSSEGVFETSVTYSNKESKEEGLEERNNIKIVKFENKEPMKKKNESLSVFLGLNFLLNVCPYMELLNENLHILAREDTPFMLKCWFGKNDNAFLEYYIAPKLDEEEE